MYLHQEYMYIYIYNPNIAHRSPVVKMRHGTPRIYHELIKIFEKERAETNAVYVFVKRFQPFVNRSNNQRYRKFGWMSQFLLNENALMPSLKLNTFKTDL